MLNKMKPEDVMRALECCSKSNAVDACMSGCPLWETDTCPCVEDEAALLKYALALLREKDAILEMCAETIKRQDNELAKKDAEIMRIKGEIEALVQIANSDNPLLVTVARSEALADAVAQLEAVVDSSDKYIAEYDDSELQRAYNKGVRDALAAVRQLQEAEDAE